MYELVSGAGGIALYFLSVSWGTTGVGISIIVMALGGMVFTLVGWTIVTTLHLRVLSCLLISGWAVFLLAIGMLVAWGVLVATIQVSAAFGAQPTPTQSVLASAITSLLAIVGAFRLKIADRWGVSVIRRRIIQDAFRKRIGSRPLGVPTNDPRVLAYEAVENENFSIPGDTVEGWGFEASCKRLRLIGAVLG